MLDRYYQAASAFEAEVVVRLTGDCPVIDPREIDRTVAAKVDFAANRLPLPWHRTTPIGMDTEVVTFTALARTWWEAKTKYAREHVMPYRYEEPGRFKTLLVNHDPDWGNLRLTVNTPEDLELIRQVYAHFGNADEFNLAEMAALLSSQPGLRQLNAAVTHKGFKDVDKRA